MGNYRFRLSDMIPNSWFYKLRDNMSRSRNRLKTSNPTNKRHPYYTHPSSSSFSSSSSLISNNNNNHSSKLLLQQPHHLSDQRKSYYFTRDLAISPIKSRFSDKNHDPDPDPDPPRKSARKRRSFKRRYTTRHVSHHRPRHVSTTISAGCNCRASLESVWTTTSTNSNKPPDSTPEEYPNSPDRTTTSSSDHDSVVPECGSDRGLTTDALDDDMFEGCHCKAENDIIIEMDNNDDDDDGTDKPESAELDRLPPIITKKHEPTATKIQRTSAEFSESNEYGSLRVKVVKEDFVTAGNWAGGGGKDEHKVHVSPAVRRFSANSSSPGGVRLRTNSPRILNRRIQQGRKSTSSNSSSGGRRSVSESFAVVKSSRDPRRDFRESMVEMIVENNIRASKDLEELLACYLSLNSDEYHDLIINVFKQIWFDFIVHVRLN